MLLVAVPRAHYADERRREAALERWDRIHMALHARSHPLAPPPDGDERRERLLALGRARRLDHGAMSLIALVEDRTTDYPRQTLFETAADLLDVEFDREVFATLHGMVRDDVRKSQAAILASEWQQIQDDDFDELFAEIVAPTALRVAAVLLAVVSGTGAIAIGARIVAMIAEAVLDLTEFLELLEDPETTEDEAIAALVAMFPLISSRLELARAGLLIGYALVNAVAAAVELWSLRMEMALGAHEAGAVNATFEDETTVAIPLEVLVEVDPA